MNKEFKDALRLLAFEHPPKTKDDAINAAVDIIELAASYTASALTGLDEKAPAEKSIGGLCTVFKLSTFTKLENIEKGGGSKNPLGDSNDEQ